MTLGYTAAVLLQRLQSAGCSLGYSPQKKNYRFSRRTSLIISSHNFRGSSFFQE